jgi:hypothetical protein
MVFLEDQNKYITNLFESNNEHKIVISYGKKYKNFHGLYQFICLLRRHKAWIENIIFGQISACRIVFIYKIYVAIIK